MNRMGTLLICIVIIAAMLVTACGSSASKTETTPAETTKAEETTVAPETEAPTETQEEAQQDETAEAETGVPVMSGGWTVNTDTAAHITDEEKELFDKAMEGLVGVDYEPVAVVATQLVSGKNYAFLCTSKVVVPGAESKWCFVTVYQDLQGNAETIGFVDLDITDIYTIENVDDSEAVGAWVVTEEDEAKLPDEAQEAFDKASAELMGVGYSPVALLATQIVAGINYKILCKGTTVTASPITSLYVMDVYADLQGNAEITNIDILYLTMYVGPQA